MLTSKSDGSLNNYFNICLLDYSTPAVALKGKVPPTPSPLPTCSSKNLTLKTRFQCSGCHLSPIEADLSPELVSIALPKNALKRLAHYPVRSVVFKLTAHTLFLELVVTLSTQNCYSLIAKRVGSMTAK